MMSLELQLHAVVLLLLATVLSSVVGLNRERKDHPAGLRTHILVGVGACMFTILSIYAFDATDTARVAAQIVTGVGFLGAGAILKESGDIKGLTTAASLWATAAIGMAVGTGAWFLAICLTLVIWFVLAWLQRLAQHTPTEQKTPSPPTAQDNSPVDNFGEWLR